MKVRLRVSKKFSPRNQVRRKETNLKQKDLIPIFGSKGKVSEILNGKRELSLTMIRKLTNDLGIPAAVLLQERRATLDDGARFGMPREHSERALYVVKGKVEVAGREYRMGQLPVFSKNNDPVVVAKGPATLLLLGGEPLGERFIWWNFVSSRKERIEQAKADWKEGRILLPPTDNQEFIPLPEDRLRTPPPANPLS